MSMRNLFGDVSGISASDGRSRLEGTDGVGATTAAAAFDADGWTPEVEPGAVVETEVCTDGLAGLDPGRGSRGSRAVVDAKGLV